MITHIMKHTLHHSLEIRKYG